MTSGMVQPYYFKWTFLAYPVTVGYQNANHIDYSSCGTVWLPQFCS